MSKLTTQNPNRFSVDLTKPNARYVRKKAKKSSIKEVMNGAVEHVRNNGK